MKVHTKVGVVDGPEPDKLGADVRYWVEALDDVFWPEQRMVIMGAAMEAAYQRGASDAAALILGEEDAQLFQAGDEELGSEGPQPEQPADQEDPRGSTELSRALAELLGGVPEGTRGLRGDQEEVEETAGAELGLRRYVG